MIDGNNVVCEVSCFIILYIERRWEKKKNYLFEVQHFIFTSSTKFKLKFSWKLENSSDKCWRNGCKRKPSGNILFWSFLSHLTLIAFHFVARKVSWLVSNGQTMDKSLDSCHKSHQFSVYPNMRSMKLVVLCNQGKR